MLTVIYSEEFLQHENGPFHPERPERLTSIVAELKAASWADKLVWERPTAIAQRDPIPSIRKVHAGEYIERVKAMAAEGGGRIDMDTSVCPHSYEVALLAVNAWLDGVDRVLGTGNCAFVLARPPGHHATPTTGMGFCLFSNAAIAALYALSKPEIERVAILDWDVHHGNGTEAIVASNPPHCLLFSPSISLLSRNRFRQLSGRLR